MANDIDYDDSNLMKMFEELSPAKRVKALKHAFRRAGGQVKKRACSNLQAALKSARSNESARTLKRGIQVIVFKKKAGFRVTIGSRASYTNAKGKKVKEVGMHVNRRGQHKPVLVWLEGGTAERYSRVTRRDGKRTLQKKGYRGFVRATHFMHDTRNQMEGPITSEVRQAVIQAVTKTAKKYGCR